MSRTRSARRAKDTVQWAVEKLKAAYFAKDPDEILDIWLFKDKESYEKHAKSSSTPSPTRPTATIRTPIGRW